MRLKKVMIGAALAAVLAAAPAESQVAPIPLTYADIADFALAGPVAAHVRIKRSVRLKPASAPGLAPGRSRFYVEADTVSVIGGPALPPRLTYLVDLADVAPGKPAKIAKKSEFLISAAPAPGRPGELRLTAPNAQVPFTPDFAARLGAVLAEASAASAPPRITGLGRAFHVPGTLPGEGDTQIFLQTADNRPVSLNISRRLGEPPAWSVALSEIVGDSVAPPTRDSLLWYRLACTLPPILPAASFADSDPGRTTMVQADYRHVLNALGSCPRVGLPG